MPLLELKATLDRYKVLSTNQETELKLLVRTWPSPELRAQTVPIDTALALVIDISDSMTDDGKLDAAITAANAIVDAVPATQKLSLIGFGSSIHFLVDNVAVGDDKEAVKSQIADLRTLAGGSTNMAGALDAASKSLARSKAAAKVMILLSDGAADSVEDAEVAALKASQAGNQIFTVGIGSDYEADSLLRLVKPSNGTVFGSSEIDKIKDIFVSLLNRIETFVATNAKLMIMFNGSVTAGLSYKTSPEQAFLGNMVLDGRVARFDIGNIERDKAYAILCTLSVPQWDVGPFKVCNVRLTYDVPAQKLVGASEEVGVSIEYTKDRKATETVNGEVLEAFRRANMTQLAERFVAAYKANDNVQSAKYLKILIRRYEEIGDLANRNRYEAILAELVAKGEVSNELINASVVASVVVADGGELPSAVDDEF